MQLVSDRFSMEQNYDGSLTIDSSLQLVSGEILQFICYILLTKKINVPSRLT